jgi:hypothetical protein
VQRFTAQRFAHKSKRRFCRGPGAWNFDAAVTKAFALTERLKLEFRAEGFNKPP